VHVRLLEEQRERFRRVRECIAETVGKRSPIQKRSLFDIRDSANVRLKRLATFQAICGFRLKPEATV
jgi:hypothetical protein